jgi:hypothetical protein
MWRQRYSNEALYPYNGPVSTKRRRGRSRSKRKESMIRRALQLKMQFETS